MATTPSKAKLWATLRKIIDPELGCNIVDLGLVYAVTLEKRRVRVAMTLTSATCPMGAILVAGVRACMRDMPGIVDAEVNLVWTPPWGLERLTFAGRKHLGLPDDV